MTLDLSVCTLMSLHVYAAKKKKKQFFLFLLPENCRPQNVSELKLNLGWKSVYKSLSWTARTWWFFSTFAIIEGYVFRFAL